MVLGGIFFQGECCYFLKTIYLLTVLSLCCCVGFSLAVASRGSSLLQWIGFSLQWLLLLWSVGSGVCGLSSCGSWALEHRLSSCGAQADLLCRMWDLPGPGIEPVSSCVGRQISHH